jgi:hypothetical protein
LAELPGNDGSWQKMAGKNRVASQPAGGVVKNLSREDALLVYCARLNLSEENLQAIKDLLAGRLDWELLMQKAVWHRIPLLVSHHLRSPALSMLIPEAIRDRLDSLYYQGLARNMVLQNELARFLSACNDQNIPVIVLKGAALLESIYRDISLRSMNDLDILVRPEHLDLAETIALRLGYTYFTSHDTPEQTRKSGRHLDNLVLREKGIFLEIHQHIVNTDDPYHFDLSGFWTRAEPAMILGVRALTFAPVDLLIHLSIKFLLDRRYRSNNALGQLCDISEVICHYGNSLNWDLIERTSQEEGLLRGLYFVFYTCQRLLQTPVPDSILAKFRPQEFNPAAAKLFIRRRVLDTRPWLAHGLLDSRQAFSRRRMLQAIIRRCFGITRQIVRKNGNDARKLSGLRRIADILPRLARVLFRPAELKRDLQLDHWLHDLYTTN